MLANMDWYLLPVVNPDGYEYSMTTVRRIKLIVKTQNNVKLSLMLLESHLLFHYFNK